MTYDPATSFFGLPVDLEEAPITVDTERDLVRLEELKTMQEVFKKRGWKFIATEIQSNIDSATNALLNSAHTMDEITRCRETIAAFSLLLNMPERIRQEAQRLNETLAE